MSPEVIQFARSTRDNRDDHTQVDAAGETILQLLHNAADTAEANSRHALDMAQKLAVQLRAAEDRVAELEAQANSYRERAERAEQWLHRIYGEIEERFIPHNDARRVANGAPERLQNPRRAR
jgi:molecular chaperone GrpE (heat shock protein)